MASVSAAGGRAGARTERSGGLTSEALLRDRHLWLVFVVTAVGAALRFADLGTRSYWVDEAATLQVIRGGFAHILGRVAEFENTPPLYYVLAWVWHEAFGSSEVAVRSFSALGGTLTIPVVYAIGMNLVSRRVGLVAALLAAVSPLLIWHAQDARAYALAILLCSLSFLFFVRAIQAEVRAGRSAFVWWAVASILAITTHYYAVFLVAAEAFWLIRQERLRRPALAATGALVLAVIALVPLAIDQRSHNTARWISAHSLLRRLGGLPSAYIVGYQPPLLLVTSLIGGLFVLVAVVLLALRGDALSRRAATLSAVVGAPTIVFPVLLVFGGTDSVTTRNTTVAWIPLLMVVAIGLGSRHAGRAAAVTLIGMTALCVAIVLLTASEPKFEREDWRGASRAIGPAALRAIVLSPRSGRLPLEVYRPAATAMPAGGAFVREIVLVALPSSFARIGQRPLPPRPRTVAPAAPGFREVSRLNANYFTLIRFRSERARRVDRMLAEEHLGTSSGTVLLERPRSGSTP
ncbi:MAG: glycosyltransferase family 39 protein [Gaiellaceae bacterium]